MIGNERHGLVGVIASDILRNGKIPMILLIAVLVSAIFVVTTAHRTRLLTAHVNNWYWKGMRWTLNGAT